MKGCIVFRLAISNSDFYTENISTFLDFYLKPIAAKVKSYIKDTNNFQNLPKLPDDVILRIIDVVGLYPNILIFPMTKVCHS